ncbi:hypothetical protein OGM63_08420 [Plectonema radiosum NIES-515]|uniref:SpoVT-AbrB domain-containing protein n=1 Tax=Plectonema radiosum NIES-515 TaxID=2986073 RepID=A0ABT3AWP2_9CYAN|nr:hypothetical protein [Plectonema radiosum]MCV3213548.1 hypothetical protein [Plectonema radiosum NIES-515]
MAINFVAIAILRLILNYEKLCEMSALTLRPSAFKNALGLTQNYTKIELSQQYNRDDHMLNAVEFQAKIQNGLIQIPEEYKQELAEGDDIKVIVLVNKKSSRLIDIIDELTENSIQVDDVLSREEIYNR